MIFLNSLLFRNTTLFLTKPRSGNNRSSCQHILYDKNGKKILSTRAKLNRLFGRGIMTTFSAVCRKNLQDGQTCTTIHDQVYGAKIRLGNYILWHKSCLRRFSTFLRRKTIEMGNRNRKGKLCSRRNIAPH